MENPTGNPALDGLAQALYLLNLEERTETQDEIKALRALGLDDPSEQDTEPGEV